MVRGVAGSYGRAAAVDQQAQAEDQEDGGRHRGEGVGVGEDGRPGEHTEDDPGHGARHQAEGERTVQPAAPAVGDGARGGGDHVVEEVRGADGRAGGAQQQDLDRQQQEGAGHAGGRAQDGDGEARQHPEHPAHRARLRVS